MSDVTTTETNITSMEDLLAETGAGGSDLDLTGTSSIEYDETLDSPIIGQQYLAKFHPLENYEDQYEERESSVVSGVHFNTPREMQKYLDQGYEKITVDEQNALCNGKVRTIDTKELADKPPVIIPLADKKKNLEARVDSYTEKSITGGFYFTVTEGPVTGKAKFDSSKEDQMTFSTMYAASKSPDFATTEPYNGYIPMRGYPVSRAVDGSEVLSDKIIYQLNGAMMQAFSDALALHIGSCKQVGWALKAKVEEATELNWETIEAEVLAVIGSEPEM